MTDTADIDPLQALTNELKQDLMAQYGPVIGSKDLYKSLGYGSADALRQAVSRKTVPVHVFSIESRKGKFALAKDVALWLAQQRLQELTSNEN